MQKRKLRIVKQSPPAIGICECCHAEFRSGEFFPDVEIEAQFDSHKCKPVDSSPKALRIVHEAAETK